MPYAYKYRYETLDDIREEYSHPYRRTPCIPGTYNPIREKREQAARDRQEYLERLEFEDQMAARNYTISVDLRNKYQVRTAIATLQAALKMLEDEVFEIPYDPCKSRLY